MKPQQIVFQSLYLGEKVREISRTTTHVNLENKFLNHKIKVRSFWFGFLFYRGIDFDINTLICSFNLNN